MALYVSIILLGAMVTVGSSHTNRELLSLIWGTTIGLTLAHFFAFRIASRLHRGRPRTVAISSSHTPR